MCQYLDFEAAFSSVRAPSIWSYAKVGDRGAELGHDGECSESL